MGQLCTVACDRVPVRGNLQLSLGEGIASAWEKTGETEQVIINTNINMYGKQ